MAMKFNVETKLAAARTRLTIDKPFLGALVLRLPLARARPDWCKTTFTDARKLYYNPEYIEHLSLAETQFVLAQEALHCALLHFARRGHRLQHLWDLACDFAINPILIHDGLTAPPGAFYSHEYEGLAAEEIYPLLQDNENDSTHEENLHQRPEESAKGEQESASQSSDSREPSQDPSETNNADTGQKQQEPDLHSDTLQHGDTQQPAEDTLPSPEGTQDSPLGEAEPPPLSPQERETLEVQWQQRLAGAAQQARQAGKLSGHMARMVEGVLEPQLPWRMLLAQHMTAQARDDYSYTRPSSRRGEPAIFPSLRSQQLDVLIALDTSGSILQEEMDRFIAEIDSIKGQVRARVVLILCDDQLNPDGPWTFEPWDSMQLPATFKGGGGTNFCPVFEWAETLDRAPDLLIYFTDAEGRFPKHPPLYPVLWLVKGKSRAPWGQHIQLN